MSKQNNGGPAFPVSTGDTTVGHQDGIQTWQFPGMTLRDYFAAKAMQAWLSTFTESRHPAENGGASDVAKASYAIADAMLAERAK